MGTFLVGTIVLGAFACAGYFTYKKYKKGGSCCSGCAGCSLSDKCHCAK